MAEVARRREPVEPVLVVMPTYNEYDNLPTILQRLHTACPEVHVLVVDDASPDGTGKIADEIARRDDRVHVLHRTEKTGLGAAYVTGFRWGLEHGYAALVEMDADGSHAPEDLPRLLGSLGGAELVIGSRYVEGGRVVNWPLRRELLSRGANIYAKIALGVRIDDITAGFRAYRSEVLRALDLAAVTSRGYCFQIDLAWRAIKAGFRVVEVPITFTEREYGESKMDGTVVWEAFRNVLLWGARHRLAQLRRRASG